MYRAIKSFLLSACLVSFLFITAASIFVAACLIVDNASRYIEAYDNVTKVDAMQEAVKQSQQVLSISEELLREKQAVEKERDTLREVVADLTERLDVKENVVADYCQTTQDLAMTARNLTFRLQEICNLLAKVIETLPEEQKKEVYVEYFDILGE